MTQDYDNESLLKLLICLDYSMLHYSRLAKWSSRFLIVQIKQDKPQISFHKTFSKPLVTANDERSCVLP